MAKRLQLRGGTTAEHSTFTGAVRELTVDIDKDTVVVHDGVTVGGHPLVKASNISATNTPSTAVGNITATNVQAALQELDNEKVAKTSVVTAAITSVTFNADGTITIVTP